MLLRPTSSDHQESSSSIFASKAPISIVFIGQLEAKNISTKFVSSNSNIYTEIYRVEDQKKLLYRSEPAKQSKLTWRPFTVQSDDFYEADRENSQIEIICVSEDEREGVIGQAIVLAEALKSMEPISLFNETYKQGRKPIGEVRAVRSQHLRICSFLDYIRSGTQLRFALAIDFSVRDPSSLTHDDHLQFANDIEFVVRCLGETLEPFNASNSFLRRIIAIRTTFVCRWTWRRRVTEWAES